MEQKRNLLHVEIIRIIAAFFVIFNHTGDKGFFLFSTYDIGGINYWIALAISIVCKISVPLFFMIAGALLLEKDYSLKTLWIGKIARIIITLIVFSVFYYINKYLHGILPGISIKDFIVKLYEGNIRLLFWYLYAYIALLISIPFLKNIAKSLSDNNFVYLIGLSFLFVSVIPCIEYLLWNGDVSINYYVSSNWILSDVVIYPLVGFYIENKLDIAKMNQKHIIAIWIFSLFGLFISCFMTYYKQKITGLLLESASQEFHETFILFMCIAVYITIKYVCLKINVHEMTGKIIRSIGTCTFGIYLIHIAILESEFISQLWNVLKDKIHMSRMISPFIVSFIVLLIAYIITLILKKIPVIRKFI